MTKKGQICSHPSPELPWAWPPGAVREISFFPESLQTLSSEAKGQEIAGIIFLLNSSIHQSEPIFVVLYFWQAPFINKGKHLPAAWTHLWSALVLSLKHSYVLDEDKFWGKKTKYKKLEQGMSFSSTYIEQFYLLIPFIEFQDLMISSKSCDQTHLKVLNNQINTNINLDYNNKIQLFYSWSGG